MVANHFRWDFIGLSTDDKPTADNPRVADGSTYYESDTSKVFVWYKDQWYEKTATGGGGYELPIASASTLGGVKVGEGLEISESGVLSASGGGGVVELTSADYNFPDNNPDGIALWKLPAGIYQSRNNVKYYLCASRYDQWGSQGTFIVNPHASVGDVTLWVFNGNYHGMQITNNEGGDAGFYEFPLG